MKDFILSKDAGRDLDHIYDYTVEVWSLTQADNYHALLMNACRRIADNHALGKRYDGIARNLRGYLVGRHIIFFVAIDDNRVQIVRILHWQMDLKHMVQ